MACYKDELDLTNKDTSLYSEKHGARKRYKIDLRTAVLVESISIFEPTAEYITISEETLVESMDKKAYDFRPPTHDTGKTLPSQFGSQVLQSLLEQSGDECFIAEEIIIWATRWRSPDLLKLVLNHEAREVNHVPNRAL